jgi:broad specificity phosphatase PhoE
MRRTPRSSRAFLLTLLLALVAGAAAFRPQPHTPTVVLVVRHAEKDTAPRDDPPLTAQGRARAAALAEVAADAGVVAVYHTPYRRTRETGAAAAERLGVPLTQYDPRADPQALRAEILANHAGKTVLVVAHSNTAPVIASVLAGRPVRPMSEEEYDRLVVVAIPEEGMPAVVQARYGPGH